MVKLSDVIGSTTERKYLADTIRQNKLGKIIKQKDNGNTFYASYVNIISIQDLENTYKFLCKHKGSPMAKDVCNAVGVYLASKDRL